LGHLDKELSQRHAELRRLVGAASGTTDAGKLVWLNERIGEIEKQRSELRRQIVATGQQHIDKGEVVAALASFGPIWKALTPREQSRVIRLLVESVNYDGQQGKLFITLRPSGIRELARERSKEMAA
jgi:site-specific DNA recombinase